MAIDRKTEPTSGTTDVKPVLEIRDLSIVYDGNVKAVDHVDLSLAPGETVGLAGESGSGKSTLALGMCRLLRPPAVITSGSVTYRGSRMPPEGVELLAQSSRELRKLRWREISIVFQSAMNALNPVLRIRDQLGDALDAHLDLSREERHDRLNYLVDIVGIPRERLRSYPHELSGGMRQRVMIAMALAVDPEVVVMDEPTTALDVVVQREILGQIVELQNKLHFAVLFITHDLSLLLEIADRIAVMYAGKLVEIGNAEQIHNQPAHPYTQGLLRSFPSVHGPRKELAGVRGTPPDLRTLPPGCPFVPRCNYATADCRGIDMNVRPVVGSDPNHLTACPFVTHESAQGKTPKATLVKTTPSNATPAKATAAKAKTSPPRRRA
jgi:peptide/nickel transport system ATP-binding protein